jgi:hypothetical protein
MDTVAELLQRVQNGCTNARNTPDIFQRILQLTNRRAEACVEVQGQHCNPINDCYLLSLECKSTFLQTQAWKPGCF